MSTPAPAPAAAAAPSAPPVSAGASLSASGGPVASAPPPTPGAPTPAAAAPNGAPPASNPTPPGTPGGDWTATLTDDAKGYAQAKGFQSPAALLESYRQLEKVFSVPQDRLLKLPENMDSPEGRAIRERLGAPKDPKDYGLDKLVPEKGGDPQLAEWASQVFHEIGVPVRDAEKIISKWNERAQASHTAAEENYNTMITQGESQLKKDWGAAYDQNVQLAKQGVKALELKAEELDGLERMIGRERLFKKLRDIGAGVGESSFVSGRPAAEGVLAPEQARHKLGELQKDPVWTKRFLSGEGAAKEEMLILQKMAFPGELTI
jgi:hypothetical protein